MDKKQIQRSVKIFANRAKRKIQAEKVILFGSHARGESNVYSDIDVIVISNAFQRIPVEKRLDILYPLTRNLALDLHPFGYTPKEFTNLSSLSTISEANLHGQVIN